MKKSTKTMSCVLSAAMAVSGFAALSITAAAESAYEKTVTLRSNDTVFDRVVISNAPEDIEVYYLDSDNTWKNIDQKEWDQYKDNASLNSGLVNKDGVIGYLYAGGPNNSAFAGTSNANPANNYTYAEYTTGQIKLVSNTSSLDDCDVKVYNATDVAPTSAEIKKDSTVFKAAAGNEDATVLYTTNITDGQYRFNNPALGNPAYVYNVDAAASEPENLTDNTSAVISLKLNSEVNISQIGLGNTWNGMTAANKNLGKNIVASYKNSSGQYIDFASDDNTAGYAHLIINSANATEKTDEIRIKIDFAGATNNINGSGSYKILALSYIGVYDFGEDLVLDESAQDYYSKAVDLTKPVVFNKLTSSADGVEWEYSDDGSEWNVFNDGTDTTARYIRVKSDSAIEETPAFDLSWEGNLVKYAAEGFNGASISGNNRLNAEWSILYDGISTGSAASKVTINTKNSDNYTKLDLKAPAEINNVKANWGAGGWYPQEVAVSVSNDDNTWKTAADEQLRYDPAGGFFEYDKALSLDAAILKIEYTKSMRAVKNITNDSDTNMLELTVSGTVQTASCNGSIVTLPMASAQAPNITEPQARTHTVNTFIKSIKAEDSEGITENTKATAVLSTITPPSEDTAISKITWYCGGKSASYNDELKITGNGSVVFGLILDWNTDDIPAAFTGNENTETGAVLTVIE